MEENPSLIRNAIISVLTVLIAFVVFIWKVLTSYQQPASQADQYQDEDK